MSQKLHQSRSPISCDDAGYLDFEEEMEVYMSENYEMGRQ